MIIQKCAIIINNINYVINNSCARFTELPHCNYRDATITARRRRKYDFRPRRKSKHSFIYIRVGQL
jgi:hypothetical protein